jgi:hypothetical protein
VKEGVGEGGYLLELGSFIGNSASTFARAMQLQKLNATVVCMDTWLGDDNMWVSKGRWLGQQDKSGQPRLYEQYMINVVGKGVSELVLPVRTAATVGLRFLRSYIQKGKLPPPGVIYLDAAHEYPQTVFEIQLAWEVLKPGGFLVGDDYDGFWPSVQQSVNEFVLNMGFGEFASHQHVYGWPQPMKKQLRFVELLDAPAGARLSPIVLKGRQWILRKPGPGVPSATKHLDGFTMSNRVRCCINGWNAEGSGCVPLRKGLGQDTCKEQGGTSDAACRARFACKELVS